MHDANGHGHARGIKTQPTERCINVTVRVVFEHDDEVWLEGVADRWHGRSVHVSIDDHRLMVPGVWVDAGDVRRC